MALKTLMERFRYMSELQQQQRSHEEYEDDPPRLVIDTCGGGGDVVPGGAASKLHVEVEELVPGGAAAPFATGYTSDSDASTAPGDAGSVDEGVCGVSPASSITMHNPYLHRALTTAAAVEHPGSALYQQQQECSGSDGAGSMVSSPGSSSGVYSPPAAAATPQPGKVTVSGGGATRRNRSRNRLRWSSEQIKTMEQYFTNINAYPSLGEYQALAGILDVSVKHVQIWFTNRRVKYKRVHRHKAAKNPAVSAVGKAAVAACHEQQRKGDAAAGAATILGMMPLYQPTLLTTPVSAASAERDQSAARGNTAAAVPMMESVIPANVNPIHYVSSLPLHHYGNVSAEPARRHHTAATAPHHNHGKPEKICSVVLRDGDSPVSVGGGYERVVSPVSPVSYPLHWYGSVGGAAGPELPLDLSVAKSAAYEAALREEAEYRRQLDELHMASSALLHLSGGGYSGYSPGAGGGMHNSTAVPYGTAFTELVMSRQAPTARQ